jgi:hypothetical protein
VSLVLLAGAAVVATLLLQQARGAELTVSASGVAGQSLRTASVTVDGELKCSGLPCYISRVRSGDHLVRVATAEYGTVERIITLGRGQHHSADFFLERRGQTAAVPSARPPEPPRAEQSATPPAEQPKEPTPRGISQLADLKTVSEAIPDRPAKARVTPGNTKVSSIPVSQGTIKINSIPVSQVIVDGRVVGNTPLTLAVNAGSHEVVFDHSEYGRREVVVQVKPDHEAVASVLFRPREGVPTPARSSPPQSPELSPVGASSRSD